MMVAGSTCVRAVAVLPSCWHEHRMKWNVVKGYDYVEFQPQSQHSNLIKFLFNETRG